MRKNRPIFYNDKEKKNEIKAGGIIYYRYNKYLKDIEFLMINCRNFYEDFGGKTDGKDKTIINTIAREANEESNRIFNENELLTYLKNNTGIYNKSSKYIVFFIKTDKGYNPKEFGDIELFENIERTVEWVSYKQLQELINQKKLHIRLKFKEFFNKIKEIKKLEIE